MGVEYKIRFTARKPDDLDALLRALPHFAEFDAHWKTYNYRLANNPGAMPNAAIQIEADGLYFCDYLTPPDLLSQLVAALREVYGEVVVEDYEKWLPANEMLV